MTQEKKYTKQELEGKVMNYEMLEGVGLIITGAGLISLIYGPTANMIESKIHPIEPPAIARTYNDAQTTLNNLRKDKNKLEEIIKRYPYTPKDVEEIIGTKEIKKDISEYDNEIKSIEKDIYKIKDNLDFVEYEKDIKFRVDKQEGRKKYYSFLGIIGLVTGLFGFGRGNSKKRDYESKLKKLQERK